MKRIALLALITFATSGCSNNCDSARADVAKYVDQYLDSLYRGNTGASAPGGVEALQALEVAKRACNRPELTMEEFAAAGIARFKARHQP